MTNFERIKMMRVETLANFLNDVTGCNCCSRRDFDHCADVESCEKHILEWLESEAEPDAE